MKYNKDKHIELIRKNQTGFHILADENRTLLKIERIIADQIHWTYRDFLRINLIQI